MKINTNAIISRAAELQVSRKGRRELDAPDFQEALSCLAMAIDETGDLHRVEDAGRVLDFIQASAERGRRKRAQS